MRIHFIAIGGAVMHQLAISLHLQRHAISGSDDEIYNPALSNLNKHKLLDQDFSWNSNRINKDIDIIILGMHAKANNPELLKAKELGITCMSFPEFIYEQSKNKQRVVIGGSHGKTTITSMIMHVLKESGKKFDYLVGSKIKGFEVMVSLSTDANLIVIEGDEYLASTLDPRPKFHLYHPDIAVISGIEWDHINVFPSFDNYMQQFYTFTKMVSDKGSIIYSNDDKNIKEIISKYTGKTKLIPYHALPHNIKNGKTHVLFNDVPIPIEIFGEHNMKNMSAALKVCQQLGVADESFFASISSFSGAAKRLETVFDNGKTSIFRDFAHAPSKLRATVDAVKKRNPERKLLAVFELHTFSSMNKSFLHQYKNSLNKADHAILFFSPHAFKLKGLELFNKEDLFNGFNNRDIEIFEYSDILFEHLQKHIKQNMNILLMSSGDFDGIKIELLFDILKN